jgi:ATP-dependent Clp protease ATP-binding subunit ClpA
MYERFDELTRSAVQAGRDLAVARKESMTHTGHLLYGVFNTGANSEIPCLARLSDATAKIAAVLAEPLPDGLVRPRKRGGISEDHASTLEQSIINARARGARSISVSDLLMAALSSGPNAAAHLLDLLGVNLDVLNRELQESIGERATRNQDAAIRGLETGLRHQRAQMRNALIAFVLALLGGLFIIWSLVSSKY